MCRWGRERCRLRQAAYDPFNSQKIAATSHLGMPPGLLGTGPPPSDLRSSSSCNMTRYTFQATACTK